MNDNLLYLLPVLVSFVDIRAGLALAWIIAAMQDHHDRMVGAIGGVLITLLTYIFILSTPAVHTTAAVLSVGVTTLTAGVLVKSRKMALLDFILAPSWAVMLFLTPSAAIISATAVLLYAIFDDREGVPLITAFALGVCYSLV